MAEPPEPARPGPGAFANEDAVGLHPREMPQIDERALEKLGHSLEAYAARLLRHRPLQASAGRASPEDFASAAIVCAIENLRGQVTGRRWDPDKCSLVAFCRQHVRGEISNTRTKAEERLGEDIDGEIDNLVDFEARWDPLSILTIKELYQKLSQDLHSDEICISVLNLMIEDEQNSVEIIAQKLGTDKISISNARRRIFRHAQAIARTK